jgi:putative spermidine/putrescine transport system permease protein
MPADSSAAERIVSASSDDPTGLSVYAPGQETRVVLEPTRITLVPVVPNDTTSDVITRPTVDASTAAVPLAVAPRRRRGYSWLGLVPFFGYLTLFFLLPTGVVLSTAFRTRSGAFTGANVGATFHNAYLLGLQNSVKVALIDSILSAVLGVVLAQAILTGRFPFVQRLVSSASAVLANFGGLPLAFLFVAAIGNAGVLTKALDNHLGFHLTDHLNLFGVSGVEFVYLYFLVPLMVLVITPALEGLRPQWEEAARNLGASRRQYWRYVAGPILAPSMVGATALLFCAAFSAYATADALTNGTLALTPLQIGQILNGNVISGRENVGAALGFDMLVVVVPLTMLYLAMQRRTSRWSQ